MKLIRRVADAHEKKLTGRLADEGSPMSRIVHFDLSDRANMIFTVKGCKGSYDTTYSDPPAPLVKDSNVTLVKGKFPLHDYKDTSNYAKHEYTFRLPDETTLTGILDGFTYDCTDQSTCNYGIPQISVQIPSATPSPESRPESPSCPESRPEFGLDEILASDVPQRSRGE